MMLHTLFTRHSRAYRSGKAPTSRIRIPSALLAGERSFAAVLCAQHPSSTRASQIALLTLVLCCSRLYCKLFSPNQIESNHTTPLTPRHMRARTHLTHILEGARACGKAVPGRHSRLCQSNTSAHPEVTCKGTTTINRRRQSMREGSAGKAQ